MKDASRRKFFGVVAAVPVVATAAAARIGLVSAATPIAGGGSLLSGSAINHGYGVPTPMGWSDHIKHQLKEFWSPEAKLNREREAACAAKVLDPDLASMRSLTPSAAYHIQCKRMTKRIEESRLADLNSQLSRALKETFQ